MKSIELVFIVHVVILPAYIPKGCLAHVALVDRLRVAAPQMVAQRLGRRERLLTDVAAVGHGLTAAAIGGWVAVQLLVFLELQALVEGLAADLADGADLASVFAHVVKQILLLAKDVATSVALVLHPPSVDGHVLLEAVETGELAGTDGAAEKAAVVLLGVPGVVDLGHVVYNTIDNKLS